MARYVYTSTIKDERGALVTDGYLESTDEEDRQDENEEAILVGFSGNGYLAFWARCRKQERLSGNNPVRSVITDTYTGEEKVW